MSAVDYSALMPHLDSEKTWKANVTQANTFPTILSTKSSWKLLQLLVSSLFLYKDSITHVLGDVSSFPAEAYEVLQVLG